MCSDCTPHKASEKHTAALISPIQFSQLLLNKRSIQKALLTCFPTGLTQHTRTTLKQNPNQFRWSIDKDWVWGGEGGDRYTEGIRKYCSRWDVFHFLTQRNLWRSAAPRDCQIERSAYEFFMKKLIVFVYLGVLDCHTFISLFFTIINQSLIWVKFSGQLENYFALYSHYSHRILLKRPKCYTIKQRGMSVITTARSSGLIVLHGTLHTNRGATFITQCKHCVDCPEHIKMQ